MSPTMKAVLVRTTGPPESLTVSEQPLPVRKPGELLVAAAGAGVNPVDWKTRAGALPDVKLPKILGGDVSGVVLEADPDAPFKPGDKIFAMTDGFMWSCDAHGCYAERVAVPAEAAALAPTSITLTHAAAVPLVALTAAQTIAAAPASALAPGGGALVHAGAGGVGHVAVQLLARVHGLTVTATASPANHAFVKACGAAAVLDYNSPSHAADVAAAGPFAVVFDLVGADAARAAFPHVAPGGAFLHVFNTGTDDALLAEGRAAAEAGGWTFVGPTLVQQDGATLKQVAAWIDGGRLAVDVACVLPLAQAGDAHARLEGLHVRGKIVLRVGGDE